MRNVFDQENYAPLVSKAFDGGAAVQSVTTMKWDVAGRCEAPVDRSITRRNRPKGMKVWQHAIRASADRHDMEFSVPCGRCDPCLRSRAARWRHRAQREVEASQGRTWFVTLTLRPEEHFRMLLLASAHAEARQSTPFDEKTEGEQFAARVREIGREITLWIKRVRKAYGHRIRYCLVAEAHKSGLPHFHALVHEVTTNPLPARILREQWTMGFSTAKLVAQGEGNRAAAYVSKYLSKSAMARIRASGGYGGPQTQTTVSDHSRPFRENDDVKTTPDPPTQNHDDKKTAGSAKAFAIVTAQ